MREESIKNISATDIITNEGVNVEVVAFACTLSTNWKTKQAKIILIDDFAEDVKLYSE